MNFIKPVRKLVACVLLGITPLAHAQIFATDEISIAQQMMDCANQSLQYAELISHYNQMLTDYALQLHSINRDAANPLATANSPSLASGLASRDTKINATKTSGTASNSANPVLQVDELIKQLTIANRLTQQQRTVALIAADKARISRLNEMNQSSNTAYTKFSMPSF
jgi:capsule polysaccharide export protein KpsE/RkpR